MIDLRGRVERLGPRGWTLFAALVFGIGGALTAVLVSFVLGGALGGVTVGFLIGLFLAPGAGVGAATVGGPLWGVVERRRTYSERAGGIVGALTGLLAFPAMVVVYSLVSHGLSLTLPTITWEAVHRGLTTLLVIVSFGGLFTVPIGAFIGWQLMRLRRSSIEETPSKGNEDATTE